MFPSFKRKQEEKIIQEDLSDVEDEMDYTPYYELYSVSLIFNSVMNQISHFFTND